MEGKGKHKGTSSQIGGQISPLLRKRRYAFKCTGPTWAILYYRPAPITRRAGQDRDSQQKTRRGVRDLTYHPNGSRFKSELELLPRFLQQGSK